MTTFEDGPAKGQNLALKRSPMFLRVVTDCAGKWDALDQPDDSPRREEMVFVYRLSGEPGWCHINRGRRGSGFYPIAIYHYVKPQPDQGVRELADWIKWCKEQPL